MELERTFETPVIDYYGMTEVASSPIACNPLPPRKRKPGSAGIPVTLDVGIMDDGGNLLPNGETGQIVVRGQGVLSGYEGNPAAHRRLRSLESGSKPAIVGFFDEDGLSLSGRSRSREIINRGGEKIAPPEVDEVLFEHPAVAEAVTFAAPHPTLGEDVAAAVVLRPQANATAQEILQFASQRALPISRSRARSLFLQEIPKGPTGKVKRVGLAETLGRREQCRIAAGFPPNRGLRLRSC